MQQVVKAVDEQGQQGSKEHLALTVTLYRPSSSCPQNCTAVYGNLKASIGGESIPLGPSGARLFPNVVLQCSPFRIL